VLNSAQLADRLRLGAVDISGVWAGVTIFDCRLNENITVSI
jgi:hypothetical protein